MTLLDWVGATCAAVGYFAALYAVAYVINRWGLFKDGTP